MTDLKTTFAGLSLRNPIIISSSGLTNSAGKNKKLAEDGAGAIVLKSLFEEQIMLEADQLKDPAFYPEASDYLAEYIREHKLSEYLTLIKESKKECPIPIIASINCYTDSEWIDFAKMIEEAGADALEINILALQSEVQYTYGSFEQRHIDILRHIKKTIKIPVIMKLGDNLTNNYNIQRDHHYDLTINIKGANSADLRVKITDGNVAVFDDVDTIENEVSF